MQLKFNFDNFDTWFEIFSVSKLYLHADDLSNMSLACNQPSVLPKAKATCNLATHSGQGPGRKGGPTTVHGVLGEDCWTVAAGVGTGAQRRRGGDPLWAPTAMETAHEVAIYIDRFHNLDLFQQG